LRRAFRVERRVWERIGRVSSWRAVVADEPFMRREAIVSARVSFSVGDVESVGMEGFCGSADAGVGADGGGGGGGSGGLERRLRLFMSVMSVLFAIVVERSRRRMVESMSVVSDDEISFSTKRFCRGCFSLTSVSAMWTNESDRLRDISFTM
jgi:hypothetical protein